MTFMLILLTFIENLVLWVGTAYLIQEKGWSPWWFAVALLLSNSLQYSISKP